MPYAIKPFKSGFVVVDTKNKRLSNKPLTKKQAVKQRIAVALSEHERTNKPMDFYFGK